MSIGWGQIITLVLGSSVVGALINQGIGFLRDRHTTAAKATEQERERAHQRKLRREEAHAGARDKSPRWLRGH